MKKEIEDLKTERDNLKKEIEKLKVVREEEMKKIDEKYKKLIEKIKNADDLVSKSKNSAFESKINNDSLSYGEKFIAINFQSTDKCINHTTICKNKTKFQEIEKELYLKYPEFGKNYNYIKFNDLKINTSKTLEENGIHGYTVILDKINNE